MVGKTGRALQLTARPSAGASAPLQIGAQAGNKLVTASASKILTDLAGANDLLNLCFRITRLATQRIVVLPFQPRDKEQKRPLD